MYKSITIAASPRRCEQCQREEDLLFCTPCFGFDLCGHVSCQSCFKLANQTTKEPKSYACPVCMGPFYYSLSSLEEALMLGEGAYYNLCTVRCEVEIGDSDPTKLFIDTQPLRAKHMNAFERLIELYPNSICGLIHLISCLGLIITLMQNIRPKPDENEKIVLYCELHSALTLNINNMYMCCMRLLDMTNHESAFLFTKCLDMYYCDIAHAFSYNANVVMAVKYYKLAYTVALKTISQSLMSYCKTKLMIEMKKLAASHPLRFAVGDTVLCRGEEGEGDCEWRLCEVIELHYRKRDDPLHYCAPYRTKVISENGPGDASSGKDVDESPGYLIVEDDSDAHVRRPGWISLEAARFEARLDAKVEELLSVYCSKVFIQGIYRTLSDDEDFCTILHADWKLELSEHLMYLYRLRVLYRQPLVRADSGYHIPTAEEVIAGIKTYFYSDTVTGLERKRDSAHADTNAMLKLADSLVFRYPPMALDLCSPSSKIYGTTGTTEGLWAITLTSYLCMFRESIRGLDDLIPLIQHGFS